MNRRRGLLFSTLAAIAFCALMIPTFAAHQPSIPTHINGSLFRRSFDVRSSSPDSIVITYSLDNLRLSDRGGRRYSVTLPGSERLARKNEPDLPVFRKLVAVPNGGAVTVHTRVKREARIENIDVPAFAGPETSRWPESRRTASLPITEVEYVGHLRGQRLAYICVVPARYDRSRRTMDVATDFEIVVTVDRPAGPVCQGLGPLEAIASGHILNFDTKDAHPLAPTQQLQLSSSGQVCWCTGDTWQTAATSAASCNADYLMVVADSLASSSYIQTLAERRATYNGFNVAIVTLSQLVDFNQYPDEIDTPVAIRNMVDSVYTAATAAHMGDGRLGYVLLLGDAYDSNDQPCLPSYYGYSDPASDAYYSFLDDPATDRLPDVLVGRLPVDYDAGEWELSNVVNKIVAYEPLPTAAWADSVLMVSGVSDLGFSFVGQGLTGFHSFFDSVAAYCPYPGAVTKQLHRLSLPAGISYHSQFGEQVAADIEAGKWLTAFFDHGFLYNWDGTFYPTNYEFLDNEDKLTVVFSIGSYTCYFDNTSSSAQALGACSPGAGCTSAPGPTPNLSCDSPGYQYIDACDAMGERLLLQPNGAVAVIGYSRSQGASYAQADYANLFRSLGSQGASTMGELLVGTRLFRLTDATTARTLMLLGDPALDIRTRASIDTVDVAVGTSDIRSQWGGYLHSSGSVTVNVRNTWQNAVDSVEVELWRGAPEQSGSSLLDTQVVTGVPAYGERTTTFTLSGLNGNVDLFVRLDPDNLLAERVEDNNVGSRKFLALPYKGDYPVHLKFATRRSITVADVSSSSGEEILVQGDNDLRCFAMVDTIPAWTFSTGDADIKVMNAPLAGRFRGRDSTFVAVETGEKYFPSKLRILNGETGTLVKMRVIGDGFAGDNDTAGQTSKWIAADVLPTDDEMELITLSYHYGAALDSMILEVVSSRGPMRSTYLVEERNTVNSAAMAVGDLDSDGQKEVVVLSPDEGLNAYAYGPLGLSPLWTTSSILGGSPTVILIDRENNGSLEILCDTADNLIMFDANGDPVWANWPLVTPTRSFSAGDINGDGYAEVVLADHERIRVIDSSTGLAAITHDDMRGNPVSPPYLVDIDGDGKLNIVVLFEEEVPENPFNPSTYWWTRLYVLDEDLDPLSPVKAFRSDANSENASAPAIADIDGDGTYEMAYVSPDRYLHVFELGSNGGDTAWAQRFANELQTGLNEQTMTGACPNSTSLFQRSRFCGDITVSAGKTLAILPGTTVRIATDDRESAGADATKVELNVHGAFVADGTLKNPITLGLVTPGANGDWLGFLFDENSGGGTFDHCDISGAELAIESHVPLTLMNTTIRDCSTTGALLVSGGGLIQGCHFGDLGGNGIDVEADTVMIRNSGVDGAFGNALKVQAGASVAIRGSVFENSQTGLLVDGSAQVDVDSACYFYSNDNGIYFNNSGPSVAVRRSALGENSSNAIYCSNSSHPLIESNAIGFNGSGIYCNSGSNPIVQGNSIQASGFAITATSGTDPDVGHKPASSGQSTGNNNIAHTGKYVVNYNSTGSIFAQNNCWNKLAGTCAPPSNMFSGGVLRDSVQCCEFPRWEDETVIEPTMFVFTASPPPADPKLPPAGIVSVFPNPFNPTATIRYSMAAQGRVEIKIYDVAGRLVRELLNMPQNPGVHSVVWAGLDRRGTPVASGVYFVRMVIDGQVFTRKMVMLK